MSEVYREGTKLEENGSKVALLVLKSEGNIFLAALKRTLPEEEMKGKGKEEKEKEREGLQVKEEDILLAVCSSLITLWLLALLAFIIYSIYQSFDSETGAFKSFGILQ